MIRFPWTRRASRPAPQPDCSADARDDGPDPFDPAANLAADAARESMNADVVAAYGALSDRHDRVRAQQDAAREILPTLTPAVAAQVSQLQEYKCRPVTLAEVRWLEYLHTTTDTNLPAPEQQ